MHTANIGSHGALSLEMSNMKVLPHDPKQWDGRKFNHEDVVCRVLLPDEEESSGWLTSRLVVVSGVT